MPTLLTAVGSQLLFFGINNGNYCQGTNGALANGSNSGMGQLYGEKSKNLPIGESRKVPILGDNGLLGTFILPTGTPTQGTLVQSVFDAFWATAPVGALVNTVNSQDLALLGVPCPIYKSLTMIQNSPAQNATSGSKGQPGYMVEIWPNAFANPRGNLQTQDATAQEFTTDLVASIFSTLPWGTALVSGTYGFTSATRLAPFFSLVPWTIHAFVSNTSTLTITLNYVPYQTNGTYVQVYKNGVALTYTSDYSVSGSVVTLVAAGSAADKFEIFYGFVPTC